MRWSEMAAAIGLPFALVGVADLDVTGIAYDSRQVRPGYLFVAIPGQHHDGHDFVGSALAQGATVALVEHPVDAIDAIHANRVVVIDDTRAALAALGDAFYGHPSKAVPVVGITGTDGKTTTTTMIHAALSSRNGQDGQP